MTSAINALSDNSIDNTVQTNWQDQWQQVLDHLNSITNAFEAVMYIIYSVFPTLSAYTESSMGQEGDLMQKLSDFLQKLNQIQADFNGQSASTNTSSAQDAVDKVNEILKEIQTDPAFASIKDDLMKQFQQLFPAGTVTWCIRTDSPNGQQYYGIIATPDQISDLAKLWNTAWNSTDPNTSLTPFTNALTAVSTDLNSQSSEVQAKMQYLQNNDQQFLGIEQQVMTQLVDQNKSFVQAASQASA